jgi:chemotaxis protein MotB
MSDIPPIIVPPHLRPPSKIPLVVLALAALASLVIAVLQYRERQLSDGLVAVAKQEVKSAKAQLAELGKRIEEIEAEMEGLQSAKAELAKSVETKEGELSELKGTFQGFQDKLKGEIARGEINLEQTGGKLRVGLVDKVLFDPGEAEVSKRGEEVLARVAEALAAIPDKQIQVSGHTDRMPINSKLVERYPTNWELSAARAVHVVRFLAEKAKVPPERLVASGYGEFHPLASNKTPGGRAKNRRIEILLTPMLAPRSVPKAKLKAAVETAAEKTSHKKASKSGKREHKKKRVNP